MRTEVDVDVVGRAAFLERRQPVNIVVLRLRLVLVVESVSVLMLLFVHFFAFLFRSSKIMEGRLRAGKWMNYIREEHTFWLGKILRFMFSHCVSMCLFCFLSVEAMGQYWTFHK